MLVTIFTHKKVIKERDEALAKVEQLEKELRLEKSKVTTLVHDKADLEQKVNSLKGLHQRQDGQRKAPSHEVNKNTQRQRKSTSSRSSFDKGRHHHHDDEDNFLEGVAVGVGVGSVMASDYEGEGVLSSSPSDRYQSFSSPTVSEGTLSASSREPEPSYSAPSRSEPSYSAPSRSESYDTSSSDTSSSSSDD